MPVPLFVVQASHLPQGGMHVIVAIAAVPLFLGAVLADWAYARSTQIQWTNFASWLIAGALPLVAVALLWALVDVLRQRSMRHRRSTVYLLLLAGTFVLGFFNALVHARDAWAAMPTGMILSVLVLVLCTAAGAVGMSGFLRRTA